MMNCQFASRSGNTGPFRCSIGRFNGSPYLGNCLECIKQGLNKDEPSLAEKAKSLASSVSSFAASGFKTATQEQFATRLEICSSCEFWVKEGFGGTGKCNKCGCSTQAKLRMASAKCPVDKWQAVQ